MNTVEEIKMDSIEKLLIVDNDGVVWITIEDLKPILDLPNERFPAMISAILSGDRFIRSLSQEDLKDQGLVLSSSRNKFVSIEGVLIVLGTDFSQSAHNLSKEKKSLATGKNQTLAGLAEDFLSAKISLLSQSENENKKEVYSPDKVFRQNIRKVRELYVCVASSQKTLGGSIEKLDESIVLMGEEYDKLIKLK